MFLGSTIPISSTPALLRPGDPGWIARARVPRAAGVLPFTSASTRASVHTFTLSSLTSSSCASTVTHVIQEMTTSRDLSGRMTLTCRRLRRKR